MSGKITNFPGPLLVATFTTIFESQKWNGNNTYFSCFWVVTILQSENLIAYNLMVFKLKKYINTL